MPVYEKDIEQKTCRWGRTRGIGNIKCTGYVGIPDRLFFGDGMLFVEFKRPGFKHRTTHMQEFWLEKFVDSFEEAVKYLTPLITNPKYFHLKG